MANLIASNASFTDPTRNRPVARANDASKTAVVVLPDGTLGDAGSPSLWYSPSPYSTWTKVASTLINNSSTPGVAHALALDGSSNAALARMALFSGDDDNANKATYSAGTWGTPADTVAGNAFYGANTSGGPVSVCVTGNGRIWWAGWDYTGSGYQPTAIAALLVAMQTSLSSGAWAGTSNDFNAFQVVTSGFTAPTGSNVVACYITYDGSNNLYLFYLDGAGNLKYVTWADAATLPTTTLTPTTLATGVHADDVSVARDSSGGIHVAVGLGTSGLKYYYKASGGSFTAGTAIASTAAADTKPTLTAFGSSTGNIFLAWQHNTGANQNNLVYVTSAIGASPSFGSQTTIYTDSGSVNARDISSEVASVNGTDVLVVWTQGTTTPYSIYAALVTPTFGGGTVNGVATVLSLGAILGGIAGQSAFPRGIAAGPTFGGGIAAGPVVGGGLAASAGVGGGLAGQGKTTAASTALDSASARGTGAVSDGLGAGSASVSSSSAATPSDTLTGTAGLGGGLAGAGTASTGFAGGFAGLTTGLAGFAGFVSGLAGRALVAATGTISGVASATATILAAAGFLGGFGGAGSTAGSSTALSSATAQGTGSVGGGLAGMAAVLASSLASALASLAGTAGVGTGQSGSASTTARSAATPSLTFLGQGALGGLFAAGQAALSATANLLRLAPFSFVAALKQFLSFAFTAKPTLVFGSTLAQALSFAFTRSPALATPNSTIQVTVTATDINGNPVASLATCTCTVTFPDGTTSSFALGTGITNAGSGKYTLIYQTKSVGECLEDWKGTDSTGNTCEFHNITPVSF